MINRFLNNLRKRFLPGSNPKDEATKQLIIKYVNDPKTTLSKLYQIIVYFTTDDAPTLEDIDFRNMTYNNMVINAILESARFFYIKTEGYIFVNNINRNDPNTNTKTDYYLLEDRDININKDTNDKFLEFKKSDKNYKNYVYYVCLKEKNIKFKNIGKFIEFKKNIPSQIENPIPQWETSIKTDEYEFIFNNEGNITALLSSNENPTFYELFDEKTYKEILIKKKNFKSVQPNNGGRFPSQKILIKPKKYIKPKKSIKLKKSIKRKTQKNKRRI